MLRLPEIERKPKVVERARSYRISVKLSPARKADVERIIDCIERGRTLPVWAYRSGHKTTPDLLLDGLGIMHLHIGSKASRELMYIVQFEDRVVILEISDHAQLKDEPRGTILRQMHRAILLDIARARGEGELPTP